MTNNDWIIYLVLSCFYWFSFGVLIEKSIREDDGHILLFIPILILFLVLSFLLTEALIAG